MFDVDHFKQINDAHGHETGDRALIHFSDHLRSCSRQSDVLIRWGGEEFLWICRDTPLSQATVLLARLRDVNAQHPLLVHGSPLRLTVSAGYCLLPIWPGPACDLSLCLRVADAALYRAKAQGRDRWIGFSAGGPAPASDPCPDVATLEAEGTLVQVGGTTSSRADPQSAGPTNAESAL